MGNKTFKVPSISCGHCVKTIEREVGELAGVTSVKADEISKMVTVEWQEPAASGSPPSSQGGWVAIRSLLADIHYPPENA